MSAQTELQVCKLSSPSSHLRSNRRLTCFQNSQGSTPFLASDGDEDLVLYAWVEVRVSSHCPVTQPDKMNSLSNITKTHSPLSVQKPVLKTLFSVRLAASLSRVLSLPSKLQLM